jgi:hypothetical protein
LEERQRAVEDKARPGGNQFCQLILTGIIDEEGIAVRCEALPEPAAQPCRHRTAPFFATAMPVNLPSAKSLRPDQLAVLEVHDWLLDAIVAHGAKTVIGNDLAGVGMIAVHERILFRFPVVSLELVGILFAALLA